MRVSVRAVLLSFLLCNVIWVSGVAAQERPGLVTGQVMDASEGVLQGARVELEPGGITAVSDGRGEFTMTSVPPGKYKLTVSYVGFEPFSTEVNVTPDAAQRVEAKLQVGQHNEVVTVVGDRQRGEVEA